MLKQILKEKELFIFDMDGTITDTEPLHFVSYQRTLQDLIPDFILSEEEFRTCYVGHPEAEIYALLKNEHNIDFTDEIFFRERIRHLFDLVRETHLTTAPFYRQICSLFPDKKRIMLTSQRPDVLARFRQEIDFGGYLSQYITVSNQPGGKIVRLQDPIGYFGYPAEQIVIFEDYTPTLSCARENGIYAVGVRHRFNRLEDGCCDSIIDIREKI